MTSREIVETRIVVGRALRAEGLDDVKFIARTRDGKQHITLRANSPGLDARVQQAVENAHLKHGFPVVVDLRAN